MNRKNSQTPLELLCEMLVAGTGLRAMLVDLAELPRLHKDLELDYRRYQVHCSEFCEAVKSSEKAWRRCIRCQDAAVYKAERSGPYVGTCHMGIDEIVYPVRYGGKIIGVLLAGQVHVAGRARLSPSEIRNKAAKTGINLNDLRQAAGTIPRADAEAMDMVMRRLGVAEKFILGYVQNSRGRRKSWSLRRRPILPKEQPLTGQFRHRWLARQGMHIARSEYHRQLTTAGVAGRLQAPVSVFCHAFKRETGQPFRMFLLRIRIDAAKRLLGKPGARVSVVALAAGFQDFSYFSRIFARIVGHSPVKYRNLLASSRGKRRPQTKSNY